MMAISHGVLGRIGIEKASHNTFAVVLGKAHLSLELVDEESCCLPVAKSHL